MRRIVAAGLVLALAAGAGLVWLLRGDDDGGGSGSGPSGAAVLAARSGTIAFFTFGPTTIDDDIARVLDLGTGKFRADYANAQAQVRERVAKNKIVAKAEVPDDGAAIESFAADKATVLVGVDVITQVPEVKPTLEHYRARVTVEKIAGTWKVSDLAQIAGQPGPGAYTPEGLGADDLAPVTAAATALGPALSYSHTDLTGGLKRATDLMTPEFAVEFAKTFDKTVAPLVEKNKVTANAYVRGAALVRHSGDRARVLLFADQVVGEPAKTAEARVLMDLKKVDGVWLVSNINPF